MKSYPMIRVHLRGQLVRAGEVLAPIPHNCVTNLFCEVSLLRRIALRCVDALSSTGFSLCDFDLGSMH
jgi:hypothetical protein